MSAVTEIFLGGLFWPQTHPKQHYCGHCSGWLTLLRAWALLGAWALFRLADSRCLCPPFCEISVLCGQTCFATDNSVYSCPLLAVLWTVSNCLVAAIQIYLKIPNLYSAYVAMVCHMQQMHRSSQKCKPQGKFGGLNQL